MTLPASGPIGFSNINVELGQPAATNANINQASYRTLAGIPTSGATISLSNFYGKSNRAAISYTFTSSTANASLNVASIGGYIAGISDITVTVNPGVYLYGTGPAGLSLSGGTSGDTLTLVNNGYIMGQGGNGGGGVVGSPGSQGYVALSLGYPTTVNNTNGSAYIGGGGGGGAGFNGGISGGGGAGGGSSPNTPAGYGGGSGGGIGSAGGGGGNGGGGGGGAGGAGGLYVPQGRSSFPAAGGGGGRIFPGSGGSGPVPGGSANNNGPSATGGTSYGAGGGGWGAFGGQLQNPGPGGGTTYGGGTGGNAVNLNGRSITWVSGNTSRVYGAVS